MGILDSFFGGSGISPEKYGSLLADVVKGKTKTQFDVDRLHDVEDEFRKNGWEFNREEYEIAVFSLWIRMAMKHAILKHSDDTKDFRKISKSFLNSFPEEYEDMGSLDEDVISTTNEIVMSDSPNLTASRLAAQKYFGEGVDAEKIFHFGVWAKSFAEVLNTFEEEVDF